MFRFTLIPSSKIPLSLHSTVSGGGCYVCPRKIGRVTFKDLFTVSSVTFYLYINVLATMSVVSLFKEKMSVTFLV